MKRVFALLFVLLYVSTSSGAVVRFHYCMGQLVKFGLGQSEQALCDVCQGSKKPFKKSCCKDVYKQAKIDRSQKKPASIFQMKQMVVTESAKVEWSHVYIPIPIEIGKAALSNAPPSAEDIHVFIRNCTYRI